jgi:hypothetical protein
VLNFKHLLVFPNHFSREVSGDDDSVIAPIFSIPLSHPFTKVQQLDSAVALIQDRVTSLAPADSSVVLQIFDLNTGDLGEARIAPAPGGVLLTLFQPMHIAAVSPTLFAVGDPGSYTISLYSHDLEPVQTLTRNSERWLHISKIADAAARDANTENGTELKMMIEYQREFFTSSSTLRNVAFLDESTLLVAYAFPAPGDGQSRSPHQMHYDVWTLKNGAWTLTLAEIPDFYPLPSTTFQSPANQSLTAAYNVSGPFDDRRVLFPFLALDDSLIGERFGDLADKIVDPNSLDLRYCLYVFCPRMLDLPGAGQREKPGDSAGSTWQAYVFVSGYSCANCFPILFEALSRFDSEIKAEDITALARAENDAMSRRNARKLLAVAAPGCAQHEIEVNTGQTDDPWPPKDLKGGLFGEYGVSKTPSLLITRQDSPPIILRYEDMFGDSVFTVDGDGDSAISRYVDDVEKKIRRFLREE